MPLKQWDVVTVPAYLLGLSPETQDQFGVVISAEATRTGAERHWILQIPNPSPATLVAGDMEVAQLRAFLPVRPAILRTSSIFAAHELDLEDTPLTELPKQYRKEVMGHMNTFLPRGGSWF